MAVHALRASTRANGPTRVTATKARHSSRLNDPNDPMPTRAELMQKGIALHQAGDIEGAERCYRKVLRAAPGEFGALYYCGLLEAQRGRYQEALRLLSHAVRIDARSAEAHANLGNVLSALNRNAEALASFDRALAIQPHSAQLHYNRGNALLALDRNEEALASYDRVLAMLPNRVEALYNRGLALQKLARHEEAHAAYAAVSALVPDHAAAHYNRGVASHALRRYQQALACYDRALEIAPDDVAGLLNRGLVLDELDRPAEALASYDQALAIEPDFAEALNNRGNVLRQLNRPAEALASCQRALAARPGYLEALNNRGLALQALNRNEEALASYDEAVRAAPHDPDAHWLRSLCRLLLGDFERGWEEYEWRWRVADFPSAKREFEQPLWLGQEDIRDKTVLLHAEQGLGDTLQFVRYVELVAHKGARVILEVQRPLVNLLSAVRGALRVIGAGDPLPASDYHCPLLSLPLACKTTAASVPARVPYLRAEPALVGEWQRRLAQNARPREFKIGICWQGLPVKKIDFGRSIPLHEFHALARLPQVRLISLQKNHGLDQLDRLPAGMHVEALGAEFDAGERAFLDSAAVIENVDLVVTSDTSVAHLAGALGRPVWVPLQHAADWRWMTGVSHSPWYPTMRLFRQSAPADWRPVFAEMARALASLIASR